MEFRILGPLEVRAGDESLPLGGPKQRGVLALLLLNANQVVSADRIIDELWGESPPKTVKTVLHGYVSKLRKLIEPERNEDPRVLTTEADGYRLRVGRKQLDLDQFERFTLDASRAFEAGDPVDASTKLGIALSLWRGPALSDLAYEPFAQSAIARLEELRLAAQEQQIEARLALGQHADLITDLEQLIETNPLRERLRGQLMLALYRTGRQAEALDAYRDARTALVEELGIEPGPALKELEQAILRQDRKLDLEPTLPETAGHERPADSVWNRTLLVAFQDPIVADSMIALAEPLAHSVPEHELILASVAEPSMLADESSRLLEVSRDLTRRGAPTRAAAFTSATAGQDLARLAGEQGTDLILIDSTPSAFESQGIAGDIGALLEEALCDVAIYISRIEPLELDEDRPLLVPFGGAEHDWAALEVAAWFAKAHEAPLTLAGVAADLEEGGRDASRLLALASLLTQRMLGIGANPELVERGVDGIVAASESAGLVVVGLPVGWRHKGLGPVRLSLLKHARPPVLVVRRGLRPGGLAPPENLTRFTWTLAE